MSDLQAALDKARSEVTELESQKTVLIRDITGLSSKKVFLEGAVKKLNIAKNLAQNQYDDKIIELAEDLEAVGQAVDERKIDLKLVNDKIDSATSRLKTLLENNTQQVIELDKQLKAKKGEITDAQTLKDKVLRELEDVNRQIIIKQRKLSKIVEQVKQAQIDADEQIVQINQSILPAKAKLKQWNDKIDAKAEQYEELEVAVTKKQVELADATTKHNELIAYEKRASKALRARESALLEGEASLGTVRRRNSVLDNLA